MTSMVQLPNPKQNGTSSAGRTQWYPYYAGYSPDFVRAVIERAHLPEGSVVLDPWNGAGTTTQVAHDIGFTSAGFDLNPVMVLVAKSRLLRRDQIPSLLRQLCEVLKVARSCRKKLAVEDDPLLSWMRLSAAQAVRRVDRAIRKTTCSDGTTQYLAGGHRSLSRPGAFLYAALFACLRDMLACFGSSNPTWLKVPQEPDARVSFSGTELESRMRLQVDEMLRAFREEPRLEKLTTHRRCTKIHVASSAKLPLCDDQASIVITSPPYCTRIDYAVSTGVELAVLGYGFDTEVRELREAMIGTSTVQPHPPAPTEEWGPTCRRFLRRVGRHPSKASRNYYLKTHLQYFDGMYRSLREIRRCLRPGGHCVLVVQDSYYKDVHNDLPLILEEMTSSLGWSRILRADFPVTRTMAALNGRSRKYRASNAATESALWFRADKKGG